MKTLDVPRDQWRRFCERLFELHHSSMVTIQVTDSDNQEQTPAEHEPLQAVVFDDHSDSCNDIVLIETGVTGERPKQHRIVEPVHIRLKNGENDRYNHVHILAESGTTILTLHPGLNPNIAREFAYTRLVQRE
jgi:uncharacterized protein DUF5335